MALSMVLMSSGIVNAFAAQYNPPWAHLHYRDATVKLSWADGWVDEMGYNSYTANSLSSYSAYNYWKSDSLFIFANHGLIGGGGLWFKEAGNYDHWIVAEDKNDSDGEVNNQPTNSFYINKLSSTDIDDTLIGLFIGCETAKINSRYGSLLTMSRSKGIDVAIGWNGDNYAEPNAIFGMGFLRAARFGNYKIDDPTGYGAGDTDLLQSAYDYTMANYSGDIYFVVPLKEWLTKGQYGQRLQPARYGTP